MERGLTATFRDPSPKTPPLSALWALLGPSGLNPRVSGICSPCGRRPRRLPGLEPPLVIGPRENGFPGPALALDEPVHVERSSKHNQISVSHFSAILRCNVFIALEIDQYRQHLVTNSYTVWSLDVSTVAEHLHFACHFFLITPLSFFVLSSQLYYSRDMLH